MIDKKICVEPSWQNSIEFKCCVLDGFSYEISNKLRTNTIGIGSVNYCRQLNKWSACDPYPDWLNWGRTIYKKEIPNKKLFYKPSDIPKKFTSKIMNNPPKTPFIASEIINFTKEWRAYIINGKVLDIFCYTDFDDIKKQNFPWKIPNITVAIDFGLTDKNELLPIEVNDPYAIGWYGSLKTNNIYSKFIYEGWKYMLSR